MLILKIYFLIYLKRCSVLYCGVLYNCLRFLVKKKYNEIINKWIKIIVIDYIWNYLLFDIKNFKLYKYLLL